MKANIQFSCEVETNGKKDMVEFLVRRPTVKENMRAQEVYNETMASAVRSNALLRSQLNDELKKRKLWDDDKEREFQVLEENIDKACKGLRAGGKFADAYEQALAIRKMRAQKLELVMPRYTLDSITAEGQAENARFNFLVSTCVVYNAGGKPYFPSYEAYLNSTDKVGELGASHLARLLNDYDDNIEKTFTENKFLAKYKLVDEKMRLVNKDGHLVSADGKLINDKGQYVNEKEEPIDIFGNVLNVDEEFGEFVDEDGKPV